jgi:subtilisin-like proprotein convertase family protein
VNALFTDGAAKNVSTVSTGPISGFYKPEQAFSTFNGMPANGNWSLRVADDVSSDTGTVTLAQLAICVVP